MGQKKLVLAFTLFFSPLCLAQGYEQGVVALEASDFQLAFEIFIPLAKAGHVEAQFALGNMYHMGAGVDTDPKKASVWFRRAAEQGHAMGQNNIALFLYNGYGAKRDLAEAAKFFRQSADQGNPNAQTSLASMYAQGLGGLDRDFADCSSCTHRVPPARQRAFSIPPRATCCMPR